MMTTRVEILVAFRGDPDGTGHAETRFRVGEFHDVPDDYADLIVAKRLASYVEGSLATMPANIAALASPILAPLVEAIADARENSAREANEIGAPEPAPKSFGGIPAAPKL